MCLIAFAWRAHPVYTLALVGNRDEFHRRPSAPVAFWPDHPDILAGRDLEAGGTWLGVNRNGRLATVTNYRDPTQFEQKRKSRGELTREFLEGDEAPEAWLGSLRPRLRDYNDFNLLVGDPTRLWCLESRTESIIPLAPGCYGLSNHLLDTPWPKVQAAKTGLAASLAGVPSVLSDPADARASMSSLARDLMALLSDPTPYPDALLPDTGIPLERERLISAAFIRDPVYGTRSTTVLLRRTDGLTWLGEWCFDPGGECTGESGIMLP